MSVNVVMRLDCPHCAYSLFLAVSLIRPSGSAYCPACCKQFRLDPEIEATSRLLAEARAARHERKRRLKAMQAEWRAERQPVAKPKPQLSDVLRQLDAILAELDDKAKRRA